MPGPGIPETKPVAESVTPLGKVPKEMLKVGAGKPLASTMNEPDLLVVNVAEFADMIEGARFTV